MSLNRRLEQVLGHGFARPKLLLQALTHRSHSSPHNERLEFLGDSVLNCVIATQLYDKFASLKEGELSRLRASLVRQETLAEIAVQLSLGDQLLLGEGELKSGGFRRPSILADALEAIFGAVYLDAGFSAAEAVIVGLYRDRLAQINPKETNKDPKTALQEWLQARRMPIPQYQLLATHGNAHDQAFDVACLIPALGLEVHGSGGSRRIAEQQAAQAALTRVQQEK